MTYSLGERVIEKILVSASPRRALTSVPGLLLDRDGVLVREVNYLHRREDVEIQAGGAALLCWARETGIPAAVVTNQAGIARGLFTWADFLAVEDEIAARLAAAGARLDLTIACPFHPQYTQEWSSDHAHWRKPGPGMLQYAAELLNLELGRSWMVGDNENDIAAAKAAGMAGAIHVLTGHGAAFRTAALALASENFIVLEATDLTEALHVLKPYFAPRQL